MLHYYAIRIQMTKAKKRKYYKFFVKKFLSNLRDRIKKNLEQHMIIKLKALLLYVQTVLDNFN